MRLLVALAGGLLVSSWMTAAAAQDIYVEDAWARASIGHVANSAAYLSLKNSGETPVRLVAVESPAAERSELHDHVMENDIARMIQVEAIEIEAGEEVALEPSGLHIMLIGLREPLHPGDHVPLTLYFEEGESLEVEAEVRALRAGAHDQHHHDHDHDHDEVQGHQH